MHSAADSFGPPVKSFHFTELASHVTTEGKDKPPSGLPKRDAPPQPKMIHQPVDLKKCKLYEMTQYRCPEPPRVRRGETPNAIICTPFMRLFRRCANGLTVETTEWEFMPKD